VDTGDTTTCAPSRVVGRVGTADTIISSSVVASVAISSPLKLRAIGHTTIFSPFKLRFIGDTTISATYVVGYGDDCDLFSAGQVYAFVPSIVVDGWDLRRVDVYTIFVGIKRVAVFTLFLGIGRAGAFAPFNIAGVGVIFDTGWVAAISDTGCQWAAAILDTGWVTILIFFTAN
jgi:hypothetical protein